MCKRMQVGGRALGSGDLTMLTGGRFGILRRERHQHSWLVKHFWSLAGAARGLGLVHQIQANGDFLFETFALELPAPVLTAAFVETRPIFSNTIKTMKYRRQEVRNAKIRIDSDCKKRTSDHLLSCGATSRAYANHADSSAGRYCGHYEMK